MNAPRHRDLLPVPTDFEIEGPFSRQVGFACWLAGLALRYGAPAAVLMFLAGYVLRHLGYV